MITKEMVSEHKKRCEELKERFLKVYPDAAYPFLKESHRVEFKAHGFDCLLSRNMYTFVWCGYVGIPNEHPLYGVDYGKIDDKFNVHGDLTYSGKCEHLVCHFADNDKDKSLWWFGFDCGHSFDFCPGYELSRFHMEKIFDLTKKQLDDINPFNSKYDFEDRKTYKTVGFAKEETIDLAEQLKNYKG